jgi:alpha-L-rhamnosidase
MTYPLEPAGSTKSCENILAKDTKNNAAVLRLSRRDVLAAGGALIVGASLDLARCRSAEALVLHDSGGMAAINLRCEYRVNPLGIDVTGPRLSWTLSGSKRGERQSAYQVIVSSSERALNSGHGDLWDSGRVASSKTNQVTYSGRPITSRAQCFWKVKVWDRDGNSSGWSKAALWTAGLLSPTDWSAKWITDPVLADPANRPRTPINCYRSEIVHSPDSEKWIIVDLGAAEQIDGVRLCPARPENTNADIRTTMYPVRFKVETSLSPDFTGANVVVDKTSKDVNFPRNNAGDTEVYRFPVETARYLRLVVTRLPLWDGDDYAIALGRLQIFNNDQDIAVGKSVSCSDSIENDEWSKRYLTDPSASIKYCAVPEVLDPKLGGVDSVSRVPMLRRDFESHGQIERATFYCVGRGFYEVSLNGKRVTSDVLCGGYTEYNKRVQCQTYDVTALIEGGANTIGLLLGYGWYAGHMNLGGNEYFHGFFPQFLGQLEIDHADGTRTVIESDSLWTSTLDSPYRWSDILDGEGYDCRKEMPGWNKSGFDAAGWKKAAVFPRDETSIVWQRAQPAATILNITPVAVKETAPDVYVFDMGQEISGWCRVKVDGAAGAMIKVRHSEQRNADGSLNTTNLWATAAEEDYVLDGKGQRVFEPHFTWHGFRFVEVSGLGKAPSSDTLVGVHVRTGAARIGEFESSNLLYNKLMSASRWTQQNMMFDVPAGCAGRSERLAWTGDIRPCVQTALLNFDTTAFFEKYSADLRVDQTDEGRFTDICPHAHLEGSNICVGSPGWADAGVSLPWQVYLNTGDTKVLSESYPAACRWVEFIHANNPDLIWSQNLGQAWGDWLSAGAATPMQIGSTAFFAQDALILSKMADALGNRADAAKYRELFKNICSVFVEHFVSSSGVIQVNQTAALDVTARLDGMISGQTLSFTVNNKAMGRDPALNVLKVLRLTYKIGDTVHDQTFAEDENVQLNGDGKSLTVVKAIYGPQNAGSDDRQDTEGSYALALHFGLLNEPLRGLAAQRLAEVIERNGGRTTTGFWSSIELLMALSDNGQHETAAKMMNLTSVPSWGHMVQGDGTTLWESFDADTKNLSLNHWTHSAIGEWLWCNIAGIYPDAKSPGFQNVLIRPRPTAEATWCKSSYMSTRGPISVTWKNDDDKFTMDLVVPTNMTATVYIPAEQGRTVTESGIVATRSPGIHVIGQEVGTEIYHVESGVYHFAAG